MIDTIVKLIKELMLSIFMYRQGKKSVELKQAKDENKKLKKFQEIQNDKVDLKDVYDEEYW